MTLTTEPLQLLTDCGVVEPHLATAVENVDPQTLVYTIRTDVTFSDGEPMTPEDVAWSIEHTFSPEGGAQTASLLPSFDAATATGEDQVTVTLNRPDPTAVTVIADVTFVQQASFAQANEEDPAGASQAVLVAASASQARPGDLQAFSRTKSSCEPSSGSASVVVRAAWEKRCYWAIRVATWGRRPSFQLPAPARQVTENAGYPTRTSA